MIGDCYRPNHRYHILKYIFVFDILLRVLNVTAALRIHVLLANPVLGRIHLSAGVARRTLSRILDLIVWQTKIDSRRIIPAFDRTVKPLTSDPGKINILIYSISMKNIVWYLKYAGRYSGHMRAIREVWVAAWSETYTKNSWSLIVLWYIYYIYTNCICNYILLIWWTWISTFNEMSRRLLVKCYSAQNAINYIYFITHILSILSCIWTGHLSFDCLPEITNFFPLQTFNNTNPLWELYGSALSPRRKRLHVP